MKKILKILSNLFNYWRIPIGMIIGGSLAVTGQIFLPSEYLLSHAQMFIVGALGFGACIALFWHINKPDQS